MNEKEARKRLKQAGNDPENWDERTARAEGYLEAIKKTKGLENIARAFILRCESEGDHSELYELAKEDFNKWEEEK